MTFIYPRQYLEHKRLLVLSKYTKQIIQMNITRLRLRNLRSWQEAKQLALYKRGLEEHVPLLQTSVSGQSGIRKIKLQLRLTYKVINFIYTFLC